jgi:hypothetical protein
VLVDASMLLYAVDEVSPFHQPSRAWLETALNGERRVGIDAPTAWTPMPTASHRATIGRLVRDLDLRANLVPDAVMAALCIEYGLSIVSADSDFARFTEIAWLNPVAPA